ncbi:MAG: cation-efflux pump [Planctomycetes bacterium]|nr:cation-efflux pump [Planctomycetota bacterium]
MASLWESQAVWLTDRLLRAFVPRWEQVGEPAVRAGYGRLEAWVSIVINTLMAAGKFALGLWINSIALIADAGHTLSDTLTSVVVLIGFKAAQKPSDRRHPHGHGRAESIATLIIATLLAVVGLGFLRESVERLIAPQDVAGHWLVVAAVALSAGVKEWMARFSLELGRRIKSSVLAADAWHHRSDAVASALVAIAIGAAFFHLHWLDGAFGIGVALLILYCGFDLIRSSASYLIGELPSDDTLRQVDEAARSVPGVIATHKIEVHDYGTHKDVSLHVVVADGKTAGRAHEIAEEVEAAVDRRLGVTSVVHVDPRGDAPAAAPEERVRAIIQELLQDETAVGSFHGLSVTGTQAGEGRLHLHVVVKTHMDLARAHLLSHELEQRIAERIPGYTVTLHMEPCERCE